MRIPLNIKLTALCSLSMLLPVMACPSQCICEWKHGARLVECIDEDLRAIPDSIDSSTQILDFSGNDLQELKRNTFLDVRLINLKKILLKRCKIHKIHEKAFDGLEILIELDLSNNDFVDIPSDNFIFMPRLRKLSLNNNPITRIKTNSFQYLSSLRILELSYCKIDVVEEKAFSDLKKLEWLRLNGNNLSNLKGDTLFPDTLRGIELQNNNWACDCHLKTLHSWLINFNTPQKIEPVCSAPERLQNKTIISVPQIELECTQPTTPSAASLEPNKDKNFTSENQLKNTYKANSSKVHEENQTLQCLNKWKNGKRVMDCTDRNLKAIPDSIDSQIQQVLDFAGNDLQELKKETFLIKGLLNLQKIFLSRCKIHKIDDNAFKGLALLVELDLSNNYVTVIPSASFMHIPALLRLSLNNNAITKIGAQSFQHLSSLESLELSNCKIELAEEEAFSGLIQLEWLRLNGNFLSNLRGEKLFPDTLRGIELQNNNWTCDCHLRNLHTWLKTFNISPAVEPVCSNPERLRNRTIVSISQSELECLPTTTTA